MLNRRVVNPLILFLIIGLIVLNFFTPVALWVFAVILFIWFLTTLLGSFLIRWNYHLKSLNANKKTDQNWVSITFDDGPNAEFTPQVLALLKKYDAKATFFCIGQHVESHPDILRQTIEQGHTIGNHTYSHSTKFGFYGKGKVKDELLKTKTVLRNLTGLKTTLYRPAFGVTNPMIAKAVEQLNLKSIGWNVRSLDTTTLSEKTVLRRITSKVSTGDIILLHDTSKKTVAVLERLLVFLKSRNLRSVTVDRLLEIKAYE